jgi:adenylate kinase
VAAGARVVLLGPPGAGKGTQAKLLQDRFGACQISTGDILRKAVAEKNPLGQEASQYISRGALVPDDLIVNMVAARLKEKDCEPGFILDGFPRTIPQAESLDAILQREGIALNAALSVRVPHDVVIERFAARSVMWFSVRPKRQGCATAAAANFSSATTTVKRPSPTG